MHRQSYEIITFLHDLTPTDPINPWSTHLTDIIVSWFTGDEWDYVILSTVRSLPRYEIEKRPSQGWLKKNLGFIIDHHQINVAITRARRGLIIIGEFVIY